MLLPTTDDIQKLLHNKSIDIAGPSLPGTLDRASLSVMES